MRHAKGTLIWHDAHYSQVRGIAMRNGISGRLAHRAVSMLLHAEWKSGWFGPSVYVIDTLTNKGCRITIQGPEEFDVKVSSRTGEALLADIIDQMPALVDDIVVMD